MIPVAFVLVAWLVCAPALALVIADSIRLGDERAPRHSAGRIGGLR